MKLFLTIGLSLFTLFAISQKNNSVTIIDFVKVKDGHYAEAKFFYENNWKVYRNIALKKGFIKSYRLLSVTSDSTVNFDLILITEYLDSIQFSQGEARFQEIIKEIRPNGPKLMNDLKPAEFRQNMFLKRAETLFTSEKK